MNELLKINVNAHTEKKNGLTYLSWAWAWAEVLKIDSSATWAVQESREGYPCVFLPDHTAMVTVRVTIAGNDKSCVLPVMNHKNQAIESPNAFQVNTAIMRCLAKAIAMHGLGLYIYAGEDLPESADPIEQTIDSDLKLAIESCATVKDLGTLYKSLREDARAMLTPAFTARRKVLEQT